MEHKANNFLLMVLDPPSFECDPSIHNRPLRSPAPMSTEERVDSAAIKSTCLPSRCPVLPDHVLHFPPHRPNIGRHERKNNEND